MTGDESHLADVRDPEGRPVALLARIWNEKIACDHPELAVHLDDVLLAVQQPDHIEPDRREARARHYRRAVGPSRWLLVIVSYEQEPARIVTALATRKDPRRWKQ
ncbi:MAG TPA: hypothetical protein VMT10_10275 [Solirubrobacteraceae bacterium]|nr:hypothetical protein [Solirubrobacteraceae bacterium]